MKKIVLLVLIFFHNFKVKVELPILSQKNRNTNNTCIQNNPLKSKISLMRSSINHQFEFKKKYVPRYLFNLQS